MRTRSEWFLSPAEGKDGKVTASSMDSDPTSIHVLRGSNNRSSSGNVGGAGLSASAESVKRPSFRHSSREKSCHLLRSSHRRKNKENGAKQRAVPANLLEDKEKHFLAAGADSSTVGNTLTEQDCTEMDVQTFHVTLTYKPRI